MQKILFLLSILILASCSSIPFQNPKEWNKSHPLYGKNKINKPQGEIDSKDSNIIIKKSEDSLINKKDFLPRYKAGTTSIEDVKGQLGFGFDFGTLQGDLGFGFTMYLNGTRTKLPPFYLSFKLARGKGSYGGEFNDDAPSFVDHGNEGYLSHNKGAFKSSIGGSVGLHALSYKRTHVFGGIGITNVRSCDEVWVSEVDYWERCVNPQKKTKVAPEIRVLHNFTDSGRYPVSLNINSNLDIMVGVTLFSF